MQEELEHLETGLRRIPPAAVPPDLAARLRAAKAMVESGRPPLRSQTFGWADWFGRWRGLAAAVSVAAVVLMAWLAWQLAAGPGELKAANSPGIKADTVQVGHSLVASFDAVAQLPGGEPVRFHCRKWQDDVVVHDDANGVVISETVPRIEVVPVRYEVY